MPELFWACLLNDNVHKKREAGLDPSDDYGGTDDLIWLDVTRVVGIAPRKAGWKKVDADQAQDEAQQFAGVRDRAHSHYL